MPCTIIVCNHRIIDAYVRTCVSCAHLRSVVRAYCVCCRCCDVPVCAVKNLRADARVPCARAFACRCLVFTGAAGDKHHSGPGNRRANTRRRPDDLAHARDAEMRKRWPDRVVVPMIARWSCARVPCRPCIYAIWAETATAVVCSSGHACIYAHECRVERDRRVVVYQDVMLCAGAMPARCYKWA